jgi:HECT-domain (ubiquitin-transferase)
MQQWASKFNDYEDEEILATENGDEAENSLAQFATLPSSSLLREFLFFADPTSEEDVRYLSLVCKAVLGSKTSSSGPPALCKAAAPAAAAGENFSFRNIILLRAKRLVRLILDALAMHSVALQRELQNPRSGIPPTGQKAAPLIALPLIETAIQLVSLNSWQASLGSKEEGINALVTIITHVVQDCPGLFEKLAVVVAAGCPVPSSPTTATGASAAAAASPRNGSSNRVSSAEALCTSLIVHYLMVRSKIEGVLKNSRKSSSSLHSEPLALFCLPLLGQRCPSLAPVLPKLCEAGLRSRRAFVSCQQLAQWLPSGLTQHGAAGAAAALLGNLVELLPLTLLGSVNGSSGGENNAPPGTSSSTEEASLGFVTLASKLLLLLPTQFLPISSQKDGAMWQDNAQNDDDDEDENSSGGSGALVAVLSAAASNASKPPIRLSINPSDGPLMPGIANQLDRICQGDILAAVCKISMPWLSSPSVAAAAGSASNGVAATNAHNLARQACYYFVQLMYLPGQRKKVLLNLSLRAEFVPRLWASHLGPAHQASSTVWSEPTLLENNNRNNNGATTSLCDPGWMLSLWLFSEATTTAIQVLGDEGLYERGLPIPLNELYSSEQPRGVLSLLRSALWHVLWQEVPPVPDGWPPAAAQLRSHLSRSVGRLMAQLHERNGRRPFAPPEAFYAENLPPERFQAEVLSGMASGLDNEDYEGSRAWTLLAHAPFLVPFFERAKVFQHLVATERVQYRNRDFISSLGGGPGGLSRFVTVQRGQVLSDSYEELGNAPPEHLRGRIRIQFLNEMGMEEAGVDGGGIFKEFLEAVIKEGFDPEAGLFCQTTDRRLYPNPHALHAVPHAMKFIEFLGKMVGKALWEGILLELPLAPFFLKKVRGAPCDVDDLPTLDPQLARSLALLKSYPGDDVSELGLTFSLTDQVLGKPKEVDLIPNGHNIAVTGANATLFVHRVADYKLNQQLRTPVAAFLRGLHSLIPRAWISMFNDRELQELIGGVEGGAALDITDLQRHVVYAGGYSADHPVVHSLWDTLASFTPRQQADFLKFVTSCPRPPLLGFAYLEPPIAIQMAVGDEATNRLPTAATCMNLLKLPPYPPQQLKEKLLYAIESGAGFDLS